MTTTYEIVIMEGTGRNRAVTVLATAYTRKTADDIARLVFGNADGVLVILVNR